MQTRSAHTNLIDIPTPYHRVWKSLELVETSGSEFTQHKLTCLHARLAQKIGALQARIRELENQNKHKGAHRV